jgi:proteasome lid subunit RPN8/RPN11
MSGEPYDWELDSFLQQLDQVNLAITFPHVFNNSDREVGGVLVGYKSRRGSLPYVFGAIAAMAADEQRATLTFTQDSWEHVHRVMETEYPDGEIIGWYHTHPGFGIFLSEHDLFIHRNFFSDESQVAQVIDPHSGEEGVFTWENGGIEEACKRQVPLGWGPAGIAEIEQSHLNEEESRWQEGP